MREAVVTMTRHYDAPRERVFAAWTQAEHLARWFAPRGFAVPACEVDARAGGTELRLHATARGVRAEAAAMLDDMEPMWARTVSRLGKHLKPDS